MQELPRGTVTFLFTDVEGSTRLLRELGDAYADALAEHRRALRAAFAARGGVEVDTQGDAFFVAFSRASDALTAACEGQESLAGGPVRVRMGLHTGEPAVTDEGYVGMDVHKAARIAAAGHGGQVLVSQSTRDLAGGEGLRDLGEHRLKDLTTAERIWQLGDVEFPPLRSLNVTNLPVASSPLVGRTGELADLIRLVRGEARLLTVTGAGGAGKTRLALEVAAELIDEFDDGVFFVPFAQVRDSGLVLATIVQTLGFRDIGELHGRRALLLLDNLEHLLAAARDIAELLARSPSLMLLVTSRAPLRIGAERQYELDPFSEDDAIEFFLERARAAGADVSSDRDIAEICRRLDRLPLALELAAARARLLDPQSMLEQLVTRLPLLTGGRRDAPERQQTLRDAIGWSYDLLDDGQRELFARLAVFAGSFSREAAEEIVGAEFEELAALVDLSLVKTTGHGRFLMLETVREYALERLDELGEREQLRNRHTDWFLDLAEAEGTMLYRRTRPGGSQSAALDRLASENDNLRAAIEWSLEQGRADLVFRFGSAIAFFWIVRGELVESTTWLEDALAGSDPDLPGRPTGANVLGELVKFQGDSERARELKEEALVGFRRRGDVRTTAALLADLGDFAIERGEYGRARELLEESLELRSRPEARIGLGRTLAGLGELSLHEGDPQQAAELFQRARVHAAKQDPEDLHTAEFTVGLAEALRRQGLWDDAARSFGEALTIYSGLGSNAGTAECLEGLAAIASSNGDQDRAGRLIGAAESLRKDSEIVLGRPEWIPSDVPEEARAEGAAMPLDETVQYALRGLD